MGVETVPMAVHVMTMAIVALRTFLYSRERTWQYWKWCQIIFAISQKCVKRMSNISNLSGNKTICNSSVGMQLFNSMPRNIKEVFSELSPEIGLNSTKWAQTWSPQTAWFLRKSIQIYKVVKEKLCTCADVQYMTKCRKTKCQNRQNVPQDKMSPPWGQFVMGIFQACFFNIFC